jgi:acetyltransferase-like isoleucine patch superfamily enzyme
LRRDHRPYFIKKASMRLQEAYVHRFLCPQFERLGRGFTFVRPWYVKVFGAPIILGDYANVIASSDMRVCLTVWSERKDRGRIEIGNCCLICPGARISSAQEIVISDNCMLASNVYITDSDWHDTYNRVSSVEKMAPTRLEQNVWIGDSAIVCKGVTIGENSIVGAGAVVVHDVPPNTIAAGNPAKVVKHLDPGEKLTTRSNWFEDLASFSEEAIVRKDRERLLGNTLLGWMRSMLAPRKGD